MCPISNLINDMVSGKMPASRRPSYKSIKTSYIPPGFTESIISFE